MKKILTQLTKVINLIKAQFPSKLPIGAKEFDDFATSILQTYNLPDLPSYRHAIATMIMHLPTTTAYKSKAFFATSVLKAMANQVAYAKIQEIKDAEQSQDEVSKETKSEVA